jgi:hypothetical protein
MTDGPFTVDRDAQNGPQSDGLEPRWWWWAALVGLILGWLVGLNVKPEVEDLHRAALDLVPPSAEVTDEAVVDQIWVLFMPFPPIVHLDLTSDLTTEQLTREISAMSEELGWTLAEFSESQGAIHLSLRSLLLEGSVYVWRAGVTENSASVSVEGRDDVGKLVTASSSLAAGIIGAGVVGLLSRRRHGEPRTPRHKRLRWWHLLGSAFIAIVWRASLYFVA